MPDSRRAFLVAAAAILTYQLIVPPVVGLADNGDFAKVTGRFNLYAPVHRVYEWIDTVYQIRPDKHWVSDNYSSEILLLPPALGLNAVVSKSGDFDLRCMGIVHGALFLIALGLFTPLVESKPRWLRWSVYFLVLLVYCDMMYVGSLNSFYMDEAAYLFLLLSIVLYLRVVRWQRRRDALLLLACSFVLVTAKSQHVLLGLLLAVLFAAGASRLPALRRRWWYLAAAGLTLAGLVMIRKAQPTDYTSFAIYNVVFDRILPHESDAGRTLRDLGLDDSYLPNIGTKAYMPHSAMDDPAFRSRFMQRLPLSRLAFFYLRRPAILYRTLTAGLSDAGDQQSMGNFDIASGYPSMARSRAFALWSETKRALFFHHGGRFLAAFLILVALLSALLVLERRVLPPTVLLAGAGLIAGATMEMAIATLCDSMDAARHCMIFLLLFDTTLVVCACLIFHAIHNRNRGPRSNYAVNARSALTTAP